MKEFLEKLKSLNGMVKFLIFLIGLALFYFLIKFIIGDDTNPVKEAHNKSDSMLISVLIAGSFYAIICRKPKKPE